MPLKIPELLRAPDLPELLSGVLTERRPSRSGGNQFAPELSYGRHFGPPPFDARPAAVIALLFQRDGEWHVPLTVRHTALGKHAGQISLPGGSVDLGETPVDAARRELDEELGVSDRIESVGELTETYVYVSNFRVTPFVASTRSRPTWKPHDREVERVVELPLSTLFDARCVSSMTIERGPVRYCAPCFRVGEDCVWGATSIILGQLAGAIRQIA